MPATTLSLGTPETLRLPAGGSIERELPFSHELLVGEPLGNYQAFVDLREATNAAILKSNPELADLIKKIDEAMKNRQGGKGGKGGEGKGKGEAKAKGEKPAEAPAAK